jgi:(heptosyl)LPS beta-1,4-glucosyltransferase
VGLRISVVLNTLNEEANLPFALRSVQGWADEIVVVDMHSDDRTREVALEYGARVCLHERTPIVDAARAFAIAQASGDWILVLDADEVVPAALRDRLREIALGEAADVVVIPWVNYIWGEPMSATGWGPDDDRHPRFFRRGALRASDEIHAYLTPEPDARVMVLPYRPGHGVHHFAYLDVAHFIEKLNRYTTVEALQARARGERSTYGRAVFRGAREFVRRYLRLGGYRDGWRGFYLSSCMAFYKLAIGAKLKELEEVGSREEVRRVYLTRAEELGPAPVAGSGEEAGVVEGRSPTPTE